jgi:hypothetical protein
LLSIIVTACRWLLEGSGINAVFDANDAATGHQAFVEHKPDVVIVDLRLQNQELGILPNATKARCEGTSRACSQSIELTQPKVRARRTREPMTRTPLAIDESRCCSRPLDKADSAAFRKAIGGAARGVLSTKLRPAMTFFNGFRNSW